MKYFILTGEQNIELNLPDIAPLVRGNATNRVALKSEDIVVDTIYSIGLFLTGGVKYGAEIAEIAKDGITGIKEWGQVLALTPKLIPLFLTLYTDIIQSIPEFVEAVKNITPEQEQECKQVFVQSFDIPNDKAEYAVEQSIAILLKVLILIQNLR